MGFLLAPAASAVIAFLTRYVFFMTESLDLWNEYWAMVLREKSESEISAQERAANIWWNWVRVFFGAAVVCFVLGSGTFACALWRTQLAN